MKQALKTSLKSIVLESGIDLKGSGSNRLVGLCPFHMEKTPSFVVYPNDKFHCFGCGEHGDVIDFVRMQRGLSYSEALDLLGYEGRATNSRARQELLRKRQESLKASRRESDLTWTLGTLIRRCYEALSDISPKNFDDHALVLQHLSTLEHHHQILIDGSSTDKAAVMAEWQGVRLFKRTLLFKESFDFRAWLRSVNKPSPVKVSVGGATA